MQAKTIVMVKDELLDPSCIPIASARTNTVVEHEQ